MPPQQNQAQNNQNWQEQMPSTPPPVTQEEAKPQDRHSHIFYKYNNLKCVKVTDTMKKTGAFQEDVITGARVAFQDSKNQIFMKNVSVEQGDKFREFVRNNQPIDLVMRGYIDDKQNIRTAIHCMDQDKVKNFVFPDMNGATAAQITLSTYNPEPVNNKPGFITPYKNSKGEEGVRIGAFLTTNKTDREVARIVYDVLAKENPEVKPDFLKPGSQELNNQVNRLLNEKKIQRSDLSRSLPVTLFMKKNEFDKVSQNFGHHSTFYNVSVPLYALSNGFKRFNEQRKPVTEGGKAQITLNVSADNFTKFLAKDGMAMQAEQSVQQEAQVIQTQTQAAQPEPQAEEQQGMSMSA